MRLPSEGFLVSVAFYGAGAHKSGTREHTDGRRGRVRVRAGALQRLRQRLRQELQQRLQQQRLQLHRQRRAALTLASPMAVDWKHVFVCE